MVGHKRVLFVVLLIGLLAGCGQAAPPSGASTSAAAGPVQPVFAFSEAVVGRNRIALGLVQNGSPINDPNAKVTLRFFNLDENNPQPKSEEQATYYGKGLPVGYYIAYSTFDKPGNWGVEVQAQVSGQAQPSTARLRLPVIEKSVAPAIGDKAIPVKTLTAKDVADLSQLTSAAKPDPAMYQVSLDQALASGKPTAVLFATPGFCKTATCAPSLDVMQALQRKDGDKINFIHVEVYKYPFSDSFQRLNTLASQAVQQNRTLSAEEQHSVYSDGMAAWHLTSEPWLYLIDSKGVIAGRYEGGITEEEIGPALDRLVAGQPVL